MKNALALIAALALFVPSTRAAYLGPYYVGVPFINEIAAPQRCVQWCWAACAETVVRSQGVNVAQESFVYEIFGPSFPCQPAQWPQIVKAINGVYPTRDGGYVRIRAFGNNGGPQHVPLMLQSLDQQRPFVLGLATHAVVCYGVEYYDVYDDWTGFYYGPSISRMDYMDPFYLFGNPKYNSFYPIGYNVFQITGSVEIFSEEVYPPRFNTTTVNLTLPWGTNLTLTAFVEGSTPMYFAWYRNDKRVAANGSTLRVRRVSGNHSGTYRVVAANDVSAATATVANITVVDTPPVIVTQPRSTLVKPGRPATFTVAARSRSPMTYQWYFNNQPISLSYRKRLTIRGTSEVQLGEYYVVVSNAYGSSTSSVASVSFR